MARRRTIKKFRRKYNLVRGVIPRRLYFTQLFNQYKINWIGYQNILRTTFKSDRAYLDYYRKITE
jgi:hypothetical protein